jgi:flavin-dependent thymidylate synthase
MGTDIMKYGDAAMFEAQPIKREEGRRVVPSVTLLSATTDPLGALAAGFRMYRGDPVYNLGEIDDDTRKWAWEESLKTHLKAPWEFMDFMFMIEAVTRSFTHQIVRQRTAVYAQESLRFAVKRGFAQEAALPPHIVDFSDYDGSQPLGVTEQKLFGIYQAWMESLSMIEEAYNSLVDAGIPAEDARGILPHCVTTRLIYKTNFRGLIEHAGNRLCTQAQFEWRSVEMGFMKAIREAQGYNYRKPVSFGKENTYSFARSDWQFQLLATPIPQTFAPVCYKAGHCVFMGTLDRGCTIRDRVQAFSAAGVPPTEWAQGQPEDEANGKQYIAGIHVEEWMANANAGITTSDEDRPQS